MVRTRSRDDDGANPLGAPSVTGLQAGRQLARRQQRRRRLLNSITSGFGVAVALAVAVGAAYIGYSIYDEQQASDRREAELRRSEFVEPDVREVIEDLEVQPKWNGPGAPSFGVGDGDADG